MAPSLLRNGLLEATVSGICNSFSSETGFSLSPEGPVLIVKLFFCALVLHSSIVYGHVDADGRRFSTGLHGES